MIRPNLAPIAIVLGAWVLWRRRPHAVLVIALAGVRPALVAAINARIHGSSFASGYDLTNAFSVAYVPANVRQFAVWLLTAEPALALGAVALVASARRLPLLAGIAVIVVLSYVAHVPFDAWWYLRYLLPAWPMLAIGAAPLAARTGRAMVPLVAAVAILGVWQAVRRDTFALARGQHAYLVLDQAEVTAVRERFAASRLVGRLDWPPMVNYGDGTTLVFDAVARDPNTRTLMMARRLRLR